VLWTTDAELRFASLLGAGLASVGLGPNQLVTMTLADFFEAGSPAGEGGSSLPAEPNG
jgi:hypothetical protein